MTNYREDTELLSVLEEASLDDLNILVDIITDSGKGRISLDEEVMKALTIYKKAGKKYQQKHLQMIAVEIQHFGGNSIINLFRGQGVEYREIVCDVADHLKAPYNEKQDIASIESAILIKVLEKSLEQMSEDEKKAFFDEFSEFRVGAAPMTMATLQIAIKASGFAAYKLSLIAANAVARAVVGRGLALGVNAGIVRSVGAFAGPIGWAITAIWTAFDLASPAYRVTVPCVIQLAYMRQNALMAHCSNCNAVVVSNAKFCNECGHKLAE